MAEQITAIIAAGITAGALALGGPAMAQGAEGGADRLFDALGLPEMLNIMQREGIEYAGQIETDLFDQPGTPIWHEAVALIYDEARMNAVFREEFALALDGIDTAPMIAFFDSAPGQAIVSLEVSAREAILDDEILETAKEIAVEIEAGGGPLFALVDQFVQSNDLIEYNVVGALNANYAFYIGLMNGGALPPDVSTDQILVDVWSQEEEIRVNTREWVYSYLLLAYQPLDLADLEAFVAFSASGPGQDMNHALIAAYDVMLEEISRALGLAAAGQLQMQEL